jgi:two-component system, NtrC family, nitrogen regulation sensor histidine kinase NtrY
MAFVRKHIFTFLGILFGCAAFITYWAKQTSTLNNDQEIHQEISRNLRLEISSCEKELNKLSNFIENEKQVFFTTVGTNYKHPILIYKGSKLVVWTTNKIPIETEKIAKSLKYSFYNEREEKYVSVAIQKKIGRDIYYIVGLLPIVKKYSIQNDFLQTEYNQNVFSFKNFSGIFFEYKSEPEYSNYYAKDGTFLFSLNLPNQIANDQEAFDWFILSFLTLCISFLVLELSRFINRWTKGQNPYKSISIWILFVLGIRVFLMLIDYPYGIKNLKIFQTKYFIHNYLCPSLGDFFLHFVALAIIIVILFFKHREKREPEFFKNLNPRTKLLLAVGIVFFIHLIYRGLFEAICLVNSNYEYGIDVTKNIDINSFKIISWAIYIILAFSFLGVYQISIRLFDRLSLTTQKSRHIILFCAGTLAYAGLTLVLNSLNWSLLAIGIVHFVIIIRFKLLNIINRFDYTIYIYLLVNATVCATAGSLAIFTTENNKNLQNKNLFSTTIMTENDLYGEFLLKEASDKIKNDPLIVNRLGSGPLTSVDLIEQKILKIHLNKYFNKFDIKVKVFTLSGEEYFNSISENYFSMRSRYYKQNFKTEYPDIFFINTAGSDKKYLNFIEIKDAEQTVGYIILEFTFKKYVPNSIYPTLLIDKRFNRSNYFPEYSYAMYNNDTLNSSSGAYIYSKLFFEKAQEAKYTNVNHFLYNGYLHHLTFLKHKTIIVSSPDHRFEELASNFSFLFIIQLVAILAIVGYYFAYLNYSKQNINYSTKIQIYLNIAFILPLIVVTFVFMLITIKNYNDDLKTNFNNIALKVSDRLTDFTEEYRTGRIDYQRFGNNFAELAQNFETDINLYDKRGKILNTSQPLIYEKKLLSEYINPLAYSEIIEKKKKSIVVNERIGELNYYDVYTSLKSQKSGQIQGIVSIPFYETKAEIQKKLITVIVTIFNIFVIVFILFVVVTYYATKTLTFPIEQLKLSMQSVSLQKENEAIHWNSKDEIGQLISEYNKMILKLQESKEQLTKTEKETAWREMAKQVAHEIKNPLTPMKLNLQYLEMMIKNNDDPEKIELATNKTIKVMLEQINTLSEIATSFSNFAKMPLPKLEAYNLYAVTQSIYDLYKSNKDITVLFVGKPVKVSTIGDKELMGRIINNLIINGIQSVNTSKKPHITISLETTQSKIIVKIKDNGEGIPEEIRDKVFLPNFSTKYTGSGLGLAMAKQGIEFFGGKIYFISQEGQGTEFFIELPIKH